VRDYLERHGWHRDIGLDLTPPAETDQLAEKKAQRLLAIGRPGLACAKKEYDHREFCDYNDQCGWGRVGERRSIRTAASCPPRTVL